VNNIKNNFADTLKRGFEYYHYNISEDQINKLILFNDLVMDTNKHTNLTSIENGFESAKKHFLDSVNPVAMNIVKGADSVIDVGSGAGFPGIPLAVLNQNICFTLLDTRKKRCEFMEHAVSFLKLSNVKIIWKRAEELGKDTKYREKYDIACARALASMPTLLEYLVPLVKLNGYVMLYKGGQAKNETDSAKTAAQILGINNFIISPYTLFDESSDYAIVYSKKTKNTPDKYPRKSGIPLKRPL